MGQMKVQRHTLTQITEKITAQGML